MAACEDDDGLLSEFSDYTPEPPKMRDMCWRCSRPAVTCWCSHLPDPPIDVSTTIIILQHPYEEGRRLKTAPMLFHGLAEGRCHIYGGKHFSLAKYPLLAAAVNQSDRCLLMFPSDSAVDLDSFLAQQKSSSIDTKESSTNPEKQPAPEQASRDKGYTLILLDGTWFQARGIYGKNKYLHTLKQVKLSNTGLSEYVIRTQPNDASLSTLECAAIALARLENRPEIRERLVSPLRALCQYQMAYGAVTHHSKQYLLEHGLYQKQVSKLQLRKFIESGGTKLRPRLEKQGIEDGGDGEREGMEGVGKGERQGIEGVEEREGIEAVGEREGIEAVGKGERQGIEARDVGDNPGEQIDKGIEDVKVAEKEGREKQDMVDLHCDTIESTKSSHS